MEIQNVSVEKLKFAEYNPRTISTHDFESLQRSIDEFGWVENVVVNKRNMTIIGGHQRVRAAQALKLEEVPVVFVDLDAGKEKALNVALNKIGGEFDNDQLSELLHDLEAEDFDLTGFTTEELEGLQDGWVDHEEEAEDKPKNSWNIKELRDKRDKFTEALGRGDNGFVEWLQDNK